MTEESGIDIFLKYVPALTIKYKAICTYSYQFAIFIIVMILFWWISSSLLTGALIWQFIIASLAIFPFAYITKNSEKIRIQYRKKYGELAYQHLYYRYLIYAVPLGAASLYFPILLKTDYFLPAIISLPPSFMTNNLFPFFSAIPISIFIIIIGILIRRPSGGFDLDTDSYIYLIFPEKSKKIESGIYKYVRHPRYLGRGFIVIGLGILANNLIAVGVSLIHFLSYLLLIKIEDKELLKRLGEDFQTHQKEVPALFPKYRSWKKFVRFIFSGKK